MSLTLAEVRMRLADALIWDRAAQSVAGVLYTQALAWRIPWALVFALAHVQSGFNPASCRGRRRGLLGLDLGGFGRVVSSLSLAGVSERDLFEPAFCAFAGCGLLRLEADGAPRPPDWRFALMRRWPDSVGCVLAAVEGFERGERLAG